MVVAGTFVNFDVRCWELSTWILAKRHSLFSPISARDRYFSSTRVLAIDCYARRSYHLPDMLLLFLLCVCLWQTRVVSVSIASFSISSSMGTPTLPKTLDIPCLTTRK